MADPLRDPADPPRTRDAFGRTGFSGRLRSTLLLWGIVVAVLVVGHPAGFAVLTTLLVVAATWEFHSMARSAGIHGARISGMLAAVIYTGALLWMIRHGAERDAIHGMDVAAFAVLMVALFVARLPAKVDGLAPLLILGAVWTGFVYLAFGFHFVTRVVFFDWVPSTPGLPAGAWLALWLVAVTKFSDMGAYLVGTAIGRDKMIPHISPGKTWQGLIGAFGFALLAGLGLPMLKPDAFTLLGCTTSIALLTVVLTAFAVTGDLAESLLKRALASKDSGHSLPGIGGVLDVVDSVCFTAPVLYFYLHFTN